MLPMYGITMCVQCPTIPAVRDYFNKVPIVTLVLSAQCL